MKKIILLGLLLILCFSQTIFKDNVDQSNFIERHWLSNSDSKQSHQNLVFQNRDLVSQNVKQASKINENSNIKKELDLANRKISQENQAKLILQKSQTTENQANKVKKQKQLPSANIPNQISLVKATDKSSEKKQVNDSTKQLQQKNGGAIIIAKVEKKSGNSDKDSTQKGQSDNVPKGQSQVANIDNNQIRIANLITGNFQNLHHEDLHPQAKLIPKQQSPKEDVIAKIMSKRGGNLSSEPKAELVSSQAIPTLSNLKIGELPIIRV